MTQTLFVLQNRFFNSFLFKFKKLLNKFYINSYFLARVEEELGANAKLTNQMFVPGAFSSGPSSINNVESGPDSLNATYISVVSFMLITVQSIR